MRVSSPGGTAAAGFHFRVCSPDPPPVALLSILPSRPSAGSHRFSLASLQWPLTVLPDGSIPHPLSTWPPQWSYFMVCLSLLSLITKSCPAKKSSCNHFPFLCFCFGHPVAIRHSNENKSRIFLQGVPAPIPPHFPPASISVHI